MILKKNKYIIITGEYWDDWDCSKIYKLRKNVDTEILEKLKTKESSSDIVKSIIDKLLEEEAIELVDSYIVNASCLNNETISLNIKT